MYIPILIMDCIYYHLPTPNKNPSRKDHRSFLQRFIAFYHLRGIRFSSFLFSLRY